MFPKHQIRLDRDRVRSSTFLALRSPRPLDRTGIMLVVNWKLGQIWLKMDMRLNKTLLSNAQNLRWIPWNFKTSNSSLNWNFWGKITNLITFVIFHQNVNLGSFWGRGVIYFKKNLLENGSFEISWNLAYSKPVLSRLIINGTCRKYNLHYTYQNFMSTSLGYTYFFLISSNIDSGR